MMVTDHVCATAPRLVSYNVHACVGRDRRFDPGRIAEVLRELQGDVMVLQEVDSRVSFGRDVDAFDFLAEALEAEAVRGITLDDATGCYGNLILSRWPVKSSAIVDLALPGREPRLAIEVCLEAPFGPLRVLGAHFGLTAAERHQQALRLRNHLESAPLAPTVLVGDLNEWRLAGPVNAALGSFLHPVRAMPTFPARMPLFALDRVWCRPRSLVQRTLVPRDGAARIASDHLPLVVDLQPPGAVTNP